MNQEQSLSNLLAEGYLHLEKSHYKKALEIFQQADKLFPNNSEIKNALGLTYFRQEEYQKSIESLNCALQLKPNFLSALVRRGMAYKYSGQTELANVDFEAVLQTEPRTYEDWRARGVAFDELQQPESALECYDKALEIKPDDYLSLVNKGLTLHDLKQYELALQCYDLSLSIFPDRFFTIRSKAYTLFVLQRDREALDGYNRAIELKPDDYVSHTWKGAILANLKQYREAITSFDRALEINSNWQAAQVKKFYVLEFLKITQSDRSLISFLIEILLKINNLPKQQQVHELLEHNLSLFELLSPEIVQTWANNILPELAMKIQESIATDILLFGLYISKFEKGDEATKIEINITSCKIFLAVIAQIEQWETWAGINHDLGKIYLKRIIGEKSDNIETAIACFNSALEVFTESDSPQYCAEVKYDLADTYYERIAGEKAENIENSIKLYQDTLKYRTEADYPSYWALIYNDLGFIYEKRIVSDKEENLEIAIDYYQKSLRVRTEQDYPEKWAYTQDRLGYIYTIRIAGTKRDNFETAIDYYNAALRVRTKQDYPKDWAFTKRRLALAYTERLKGERKENLEIAISCYVEALEVYTESDYPEDWGLTLLSLAGAYIERIEEDRKDNLEIAINYCHAALRVFTEEDNPSEWALVFQTLSGIFLFRIEEERKDNLETAINCCDDALRVFTEENNSYQWGITLLNRGAAYVQRIKGERKNNIKTGIACLNAALRVLTKEDNPKEWAMTYMNGGLAYIYRIEGDRKDNLETAIACFIRALEVFTDSNYSKELATVQLNLSSAFFSRIAGNKEQNVETAINYCYEALKIFTKTDFPKEWGLVNLNLGAAFLYKVNDNREDNLDTAIYYLNQALEVLSKEDFPEEWASVHVNLGSALIYKTTDNREKNIKDGIAILERALNVFSKEHLPHEWAIIQQNLGVAYEERIAGDRAENIQKAIEYYQAALTIETLQTNLFRCLHIANILGSLAFSQGNWQLAIEAYSIAIEAIETNRLISTDDARRQEIISESISVYTNMVQALINNGQIEQAIEYAERSRCRRLVDLMASNDLYNDGNIPPKVAEYLEEYEAKQKLIDEERNRFIDNHNGTNTRGILFPNSSQNITRAIYEESNDKIKQLESEKAKIWQKIRSLDKILSEQIQVTPIPFDDICQLIPDSQTALVYFYTTQTKIQIFVILKDKTIKLHTTDLDFAELHDFAFNSWIIPYCDDFELWKEQMPQNLEKLASNLKLSELVHSYLQDIEELIIIPHLYLHLIPFAALPILPFKKEDLEVIETSQELSENNLQKLLGERFRIRILPSAQILQFCHQRDSTSGSKTDYGMIEDADNTLPFSQYEGEQIAQIFNISDTNRLRGKTQATVNKYRELVERVQVIHSCHHAVSRLDNPLESHLVLADGTISLGSLMSPGWRLPNLKDVFLSCCETNLGITELSDDPLTLATGFLCAGARSVVSTLWKVDDLATAIFSIIYYQLRNDGLNRSTALQQTQDRLKTITGEELKQRFYDEISQYFKTQQKLAHKQYQDCNSRLENLTRDTSEDEKTKTEKKEWNEIMNKLKNSRNWFDQVIKEDLPFAHPYYWAGFISQGLR